MTSNTIRDIRAALEQSRRAVLQTLDTLVEPHEELLKQESGAVSVTPGPVSIREWDSRIGQMAEMVFAAGGFAAPLFEVEKQETIVDQLVTDYRAGFPLQRAWFEKLGPIRDEFVAAIDAALKETPAYGKLDFGRAAGTRKSGLKKDVLVPKDLVEDLDIGVAAVRKRVRNGTLGPWTRKGSRWMILKKDLERWLSDAAVKIKDGRSKADAEQRADILRLLEGRKRRGSGGGGGGGGRRKPS